MNENDLQRLADMIRESESTVFFGGAGVSTESGMKDFRSEDGIYNTVTEYHVPPETILSHTFFCRHTDVFYDFYYRYCLEGDVSPNRAHLALAKLEQMGKLDAVITQNIDGLHQRAGSRRVIELHGSVLRNHCTACGKPVSVDEVRAAAGGVPRCACGGVVKPDVVLYEEPLDEDAITGAIDAISRADLLIIGGTSLAVYPAAGFIRYFRGANTVLINRGETDFDSRATLVFRDSIGEVLERCVAMV